MSLNSYRVVREETTILVTDKWWEVVDLIQHETVPGKIELQDGDGFPLDIGAEQARINKLNLATIRSLTDKKIPPLLEQEKQKAKMEAVQEKLQLIKLGKKSALPAKFLTQSHRAYVEKTINDMAKERRSWWVVIDGNPNAP